MKKSWLFFVVCAAFAFNVSKVSAYELPDIATGLEEQQIISTLENDNRILDSEIERCEKKKKGWVAATVIGGVGVVSTGVAAAVQGSKISQEKTKLQQKQTEYQNLQTEKANIKE